MSFIYCIKCPQTGLARYVGFTRFSLEKRLGQHLREVGTKRAGHTKKNRWIKLKLREGLKPVIELIEEVPDGACWKTAEMRWIKHYRDLYGRDFILNHTDGGQGANGYKLSEEARQKAIAVLRAHPTKVGHPVSTETRRKISLSLTGRKSTRTNYRHDTATRQKLRATHLGKRPTEETLRKLSAARMGHATSADTRAKIGRANSIEAARKRVMRIFALYG